jgi:hypothetical protein
VLEVPAYRFEEQGYRLAADMLYIKMLMPNDWCGFEPAAETAMRWSGFPPFDPLDACAQQNETQHPGPVELVSCAHAHMFSNIGQWPLCAGWSIGEYERGMRTVLAQVAHYSVLNEQVPVNLLATNPLEERLIECTSDCPGPLETCPMHPPPDCAQSPQACGAVGDGVQSASRTSLRPTTR